MRATALVVAAGSGERLGAAVPKALVVVAGRSLLDWSLSRIAAVEAIDEVIVALPPGQALDAVAGAAGAERAGAVGQAPPSIRAVAGGATRSESVRNALAAADPGADAVVVHDAARPLARPELFARCLDGLAHADAAIAAVPVTDTIKQCDPDGRVRATPDRRALWAVQTPQAFRAAALRAALAAPAEALAAATDDAMLVEQAGGTVIVVESSTENLKVTTPHDLRVAELLLAA